MIEHIRSILVGLTKEFGVEPEEESYAVAYGLSLAQTAGAHLAVQAASQRLHLRNSDINRTIAGLVGSANARLRHLARVAAEQARREGLAAGVIIKTHTPHLSFPALLASFTALAHVHDLSVIDAEPEPIHPDRDLIQALLISSGRPLLVVPPGWEAFRARRMLIGWDGTGRAARAVHDALPFLRHAEAVQIVAVTGEKDLPETVNGADLAPHLARHGVAVDVNCSAARSGDVAQTLREAAAGFGAEMIVMGGYAHSRLRQLVFGGVTQSLLKSSPVPLLMSY